MKIKYDRETDTLTMRFSDVPIFESDEEKPGVIVDYDQDGNIIGFEILDASARIPEPQKVELRGELVAA